MTLDDLKEVVAAYTRSMSEALGFVEDRKPGVVQVLEGSVKEALDGLHGVILELRSGEFDSGAAVTDDVLAQLGQVQARYTAVSERAMRLKGYEELFDQAASNFGDVEQVCLSVQHVRLGHLAYTNY